MLLLEWHVWNYFNHFLFCCYRFFPNHPWKSLEIFTLSSFLLLWVTIDETTESFIVFELLSEVGLVYAIKAMRNCDWIWAIVPKKSLLSFQNKGKTNILQNDSFFSAFKQASFPILFWWEKSKNVAVGHTITYTTFLHWIRIK